MKLQVLSVAVPAMMPASSLLSRARRDSWEGVHGDHLELARNSACH